jgi:hypothetical protein
MYNKYSRLTEIHRQQSHYQGLDRMVLSGGWGPGISDAQCDELEEDCASFSRDMADAALKDLDLLP